MRYKESVDLFNNAFRRRLYIMLTLLLVLFVSIGSILFSYYRYHFKNLLDNEVKWKLEHISSSNVRAVQSKIQSKQEALKYAALSIGEGKELDKAQILQKLEGIKENQRFYDIGIIDENGIGYMTSGEILDLSTYDYYQRGMEGSHQITMSYKMGANSTRVNLITYPIYKNEKVKMVLVGAYKSKDLHEILNTIAPDGLGSSVVIDNKGTLVTVEECNDDNQATEDQECNFLANIKKNNVKVYNKILEDMASNKKDSVTYTIEGKEYVAYYEPVMIEDWYLVSVIPSLFVYQNINELTYSINLMIVLGLLMFIIFISVVVLNYIKYQKRVAHIVFMDELTQEKNLEYLKMDFANMNLEDRQNHSLVVLDINKFKTINMIYGTQVGDELLKLVPKVFKQQLPGDKMYKDRADLFIAIIQHHNEQEVLNKICPLIKGIQEAVDQKWSIPISISMGICEMKYSNDLNEIYNNALIAKNNVKGKLDQAYHFFDADSRSKMIRNTEIETKFLTALENEEFEVWYQPKYDMRNRKIIGVEALIRWREGGEILRTPGEFIPIFEHNGQIIELDKEVIRQVCRDMSEMAALGIESVRVSINLSRLHLEHFGILKVIKEMIEKYKVDPNKLSFEITESALIDNGEALDYMVSELHELGVTVEMDDYGVGTSTISSLLSSKFDVLKLDKSFIDQIGQMNTDIVIQSTICMARKLNMEVIAEGIEHEEQVAFLITNGCYLGQGFYFSKPLEKKYYRTLLLQENKELNHLSSI